MNAVGVLWFNKDRSSVDIDLDIWSKVFKINLESMVHLSKIIIPKMKKSKFGSPGIWLSGIPAKWGIPKLVSKPFIFKYNYSKICNNMGRNG